MDAFSTEDVLHILAQNVDCQATLCGLCRVSKMFFNIFQHALYRRIWLEHYSSPTIATISRLPKDSHLKFAEEFHIGQRAYFFGADRYEPDNEVEIEALSLSLQKMINFAFFHVCGVWTWSY
jgi:hypothetical protein